MLSDLFSGIKAAEIPPVLFEKSNTALIMVHVRQVAHGERSKMGDYVRSLGSVKADHRNFEVMIAKEQPPLDPKEEPQCTPAPRYMQ